MKKISFMYITDPHATAKGYSGRKDDVPKAIIKLFKEVKSIYKERKLDFILNGGDFFHTPDVSNKYCGELASILKGTKMYVVPGNHDLYGYSINTIDNSKLGLLAKSDVLKILDRNHPFSVKIGNKVVTIEGQEYYAGIDTNVANDYRIDNKSDFNILVAHSMLLKEPFMPDIIKQTLIKDVNTEADIILSGHYHPGWEETTKGNTMFFNPGAAVRVENTKDNKTRKPRCIIFTINENLEVEYEYVEFKCSKPSEDIFKEAKENNGENIYGNAVENIREEIDNAKFNSLDPLVALENYRKDDEKSNKIIDIIKRDLEEIEENTTIDKGYVSSKEEIYITSVHLKNFECHKDKKIDFVNGLNAILGETNSGKTAILRGIYWVLYDKPNGNDNIRTGSRFCSVEVVFSNGFKVTRRRTNSSAGTYTVVSPDGVKEEYKGFSNNIPIEVLNAMQMPEVFISGNKYRFNIASQLEGPFLISNTPSEKIALIGSLVNAERIDKTISNYKNKRNIVKRDIGNVEDQIKKIDQDMEELGDIDKLRKNLDLLNRVREMLNLKINLFEKLNSIQADFLNTKLAISSFNSKLNFIKLINNDYITELNNKVTRLNSLKTLNENYQKTLNELNIAKEKLKNNLYSKEINNVHEKVNSSITNIKILKDLLNRYSAASKEFDNSKERLDFNNYSKDIETQYEKVNDEIKHIEKSIDILNRYSKEISNNNNLQNKINSINNVDGIGKVDELISSLIDINNINCLYLCEKELLNSNSMKVKDVNNDLNDIDIKREDLINEFSKDIHICETCGQVIDSQILIEV